MKKALVAVGLVLGLVPNTGRTAPPKFDHQPLVCAPNDGNAVFVVKLAAPVPVESVRVYFRAAQKVDDGDYYVELRHRGNGEYWGLLPIPASETDKVEYRVGVKDADGAEAGTDLIATPVRNDCDVPLTDEEKRFAKNLVIGQTKPNQNTVPPGFLCTGIISEINVIGELRPNFECQRVPPVLWIAGGAAAAAGSVVVVTNTGGGGPGAPVSPARPAAPQPTR